MTHAAAIAPDIEAWLIHAANDGRPVLCGWARTEDEANAAVWRMCDERGIASEEGFFFTRTDGVELASLVAQGLVPAQPSPSAPLR